jgi:hypothetical protein
MVFTMLGSAGWGFAATPAESDGAGRDALVYKDGDRVQGKFVERAGDTIVFKSERFGELRVPATDAVVIMAERAVEPAKPAPTERSITAPTPSESHAAAQHADQERVKLWERFSPWVLTAKVRNYFGPWHGRFAFSTEVISDTSDRSATAIEGHMQRKWESDEVQLTARYDYNKTNNLVTTDVIKASGSYRHDFSNARFALYRPTLELDRANNRNGVPNDYVLLQQEIGVGFNLVTKPSRKIRVGVAENIFDVWNSAPVTDHSSRAVESFFEETEFTLPWRMTLSQRGVWYYPISSHEDGWENRVDLNKKLTETLSVAVRHEIRRQSPDGSAQDYPRLKLLFGLDF